MKGFSQEWQELKLAMSKKAELPKPRTIDEVLRDIEGMFGPMQPVSGHVHVKPNEVLRIHDSYTVDLDYNGHSGCKHEWKNYVGFNEAYKYCTKCPEKRNLDEQ